MKLRERIKVTIQIVGVYALAYLLVFVISLFFIRDLEKAVEAWLFISPIAAIIAFMASAFLFIFSKPDD